MNAFVVIISILTWIVLASLNAKLGRIAAALESIAGSLAEIRDLRPGLQHIADIELPTLSAALGEVSRSLDETINPVVFRKPDLPKN